MRHKWRHPVAVDQIIGPAIAARATTTSRDFTFSRFVAILLALLAFSVFSFSVNPARAADEVVQFDNPAHKDMYQGLLKEYRCLKCQNQNLWDSNASLAGDLRREIREQIVAGNSKADIDEYLVARYGEFVLYRPRFTAKTAILWIGPFVLLLVGLISLVVMVRKKSKSSALEDVPERRAEAAAELHSSDKLAKARDLLKE
ncbi:MAG: cytochrome c-type biogenesis protein CcmH [Granulosicoccus sp.]